MCAKYTTIKISERDRKLLERAQEELKKQGLETLADLGVTCPQCNDLMDGVSIKAEYWKCPHCGYSEKGLTIGTVGTFALGAIAGAGAAALLWWLSKQRR